MWRACRNILPSKCRLKSKGLDVETNCDICGREENTSHILWGCKTVAEVWSASKVKLPYLLETHLEFLDIVWEIRERCSVVDWELFVITVWCLWNNRNTIRHEGRGKTVVEMVWMAAEYAKEVRQSHQVQTRSSPPGKLSWSPPNPGWYKINADGAIFGDIGCSGMGVVIRNENGQLMDSICKKMLLPLGALESEAKVVEEGIHLAWDLGLKDVIVESDSLSMVNVLRGLGPTPSSTRKVSEDIEMTLRQFRLWKTSHINRGSNRAAHLLAQYARQVDDCFVWVEDTHSVIGNQI